MSWNIHGSCHTILIEYLRMHQISDDQKLQWFSVCEKLLKMSLLVTRQGFTVITLKPNNNPHTGRVLLRLAPRKHKRCTCKWKQYCLFFAIIKALSITNSLLKVRHSRFLSGGSEKSLGCGMKNMTWNVDCRTLAPPSQQCACT
jgi:hypothetical protein